MASPEHRTELRQRIKTVFYIGVAAAGATFLTLPERPHVPIQELTTTIDNARADWEQIKTALD